MILTRAQKDELKKIPMERFEAIGHKQNDEEMTKEEFLKHEAEVKKYLEANKRG